MFKEVIEDLRQRGLHVSTEGPEIWEEVSLWEEIKCAFSDVKDEWKHVVAYGNRYVAYFGQRNSLVDLITWEESIFTATKFDTYSEADRVLTQRKHKVITIKPIRKA